MKKVVLTVSVILLGVFVSFAAKIDGKWVTSAPGPDGDMLVTFVFKVEGEKLTGNVSTPMGEMVISNGKVSGDNFSFDVDMGGMAISHKGVVEGDVLKLKVDMPQDFGGAPSDFILKKAE